MRELGLTAEQLIEATRTLEALRCRLREVSLDQPELAELLRELRWLQGELRKRRRRELQPVSTQNNSNSRRCYVCKQPVIEADPVTPYLCSDCRHRHQTKREQTADCRGRVALLTGGRVKIGYQVSLKLLRAGAEVIATTRFPRDAARRYAAEPDAAEWVNRLHLLPLDLRCLPVVEQFVTTCLIRWPQLDFFIHNAAQTVRRPPAFYRHLIEAEGEPLTALPDLARPMLSLATTAPPAAGTLTTSDSAMAWSAWLSQVPLLAGDETHDPALFPPGVVDADGQQIDRRAANSWHWLLADVPTVELVEVHAANCIAPFILLRELLPLFRAGPPRDRFAVMVSAAEGRFNIDKPPRHPHTNMSRAALNMLVRTAAADLTRERVHLTAVDPGWVSLEFAEPVARQMEADGTIPPLDTIDAAARIVDPIFSAINGAEPVSGILLKDYQPADW